MGEIWIQEAARRHMPAQRPATSEQCVATPLDFVRAIEERFGMLEIDLAATADNAKASKFIAPEQDSLSSSCAWEAQFATNAFLNPEFGDLKRWTAKCAAVSRVLRGQQRILMLAQASVGAEWYWQNVAPHAYVLVLSPRLKFVGHAHQFPKDLMLAVYSSSAGPGMARWRWKP